MSPNNNMNYILFFRNLTDWAMILKLVIFKDLMWMENLELYSFRNWTIEKNTRETSSSRGPA